jgi:hypothetical protein
MTMTLLRPCAKTHVSHHLELPHNPVARPKHALQGALPYRASSTGETYVCLHGAITPLLTRSPLRMTCTRSRSSGARAKLHQTVVCS